MRLFQHKKYCGLAALLIILSFGSCSKIDQFGNMNQNPGASVTPVPSGLLTNVLAGIGGYAWATTQGLYCQYFTETQYTETSRYSYQTFGLGLYSGYLFDLQTIINYNSDPATATTAAQYGSNANQIAVARILKAYFFWYLTDNLGDIPYSAALKGDNGIVPYDTQESIYTALFKELNEAVAQFDNGLTPVGDILFSGDLTKWKKFANSLHALMALHLSKVNPSLGKAEFNKALSASGGVFGVGESAKVAYPGGNFPNPFYNYYDVGGRRDYAVTKTMTDILSSYKDNRINAYASSTVGFPYGLARDNAIAFFNANTNWARIMAASLRTSTSPMYVIASCQVYLARAEAAQLGWTSESVTDMYKTGISESWKLYGVYNDADFSSYMSQSAVDLSQGNVIPKIALQEWLADFPNGTLGWADWKRNGYPVLTPAPGQSQAIPRRFGYSSTEYSLNPKYTAAAAALYTVDGQTDSQYGRMWWDKQ